MELGLNLVMVRPGDMPGIAARAEAAGYGAVFVPDHVVFPVQVDSPYPYSPDGSFPFALDTPLYDPWVVLGTIAAATSTIKLGTGVYVLPLRHPFVTARAVTSVDVLSGGRAVLGVGAGWLAEEFTALGLDPRRRFSRLEECVDVLRALWTEEQPSYHGRHFDFEAVHFAPRPASTPHPPILLGGDSDHALARAARIRRRLDVGWRLHRRRGDRRTGERGPGAAPRPRCDRRVRDHHPVPAPDPRRPRPARGPRRRPGGGDAVEPRSGGDPRARGVRGDRASEPDEDAKVSEPEYYPAGARGARRRQAGGHHGLDRSDDVVHASWRPVEPARPALARRRPASRRPRGDLPGERPDLPGSGVGGAALGSLLHADQLAAHATPSSTTWSTTAAPSHWSRRRTSPTPRPGSVNGCRGCACASPSAATSTDSGRTKTRATAHRRHRSSRRSPAARCSTRPARPGVPRACASRSPSNPRGRCPATSRPTATCTGSTPTRCGSRRARCTTRDRSTDASRRSAPEARSW